MTNVQRLLHRVKEITIRNHALHHTLAWSFIGYAGLTSSSPLVIVPALAGAAAYFASNIGGTTVALVGNRDADYEKTITAKASKIGIYLTAFTFVATSILHTAHNFYEQKYRALEEKIVAEIQQDTYVRTLKSGERYPRCNGSVCVFGTLTQAPTAERCGEILFLRGTSKIKKPGIIRTRDATPYRVCLP